MIVLRKQQPDRPRGFRVPGSPYLPLLSIATCLVLMMSLPVETWVRFFKFLADRWIRDLLSVRTEA